MKVTATAAKWCFITESTCLILWHEKVSPFFFFFFNASYKAYKESLGIEEIEEIHYRLKELTTHANLKLPLEIYDSNKIIL